MNPLLAQALFDPSRWDGWFRLTVGDWNPAVVPIGVLLYLPFVPLFWWAGRRATLWLIPLSTLALSWATLGAAYAALLAVVTAASWIVTVLVRSALARTASPAAHRPAGGRSWNAPVVVGCAALVGGYSLIVFWPQPAWLPNREPPLYFYAQWAGLAYLALKALQVLIDLGRGNISVAPMESGLAGCAAPAPLTFGRYVAFLLFAPSLRMGPIFRYQAFVAELEAAPAQRTRRALAAGFGRIGLGLLRLGLVMAMIKEISARELFEAPDSLKTYQIILGLYLQPLSIFMWIAGYSDMAIGIGRLCGFRVPENFNFPWLATSIAEFWRRWHMTLSFWLRDYVYIPLGGNRRHVEFNYVATFVFVGAWHGLYASYILWGLSQGLGLSVYRHWSRYWRRQGETGSALYRRLGRVGLCGGRPGIFLAWLVTFHYQMLTIALFMDEGHCLTRVGRELLARFGLF